jgi:dinuclear metal center YbgI/SA1388 family protein
MAIKTTELIRQIEVFAPLAIQEEWDNCGWQINLHRVDTSKLLIALEITDAVIEEAVSVGADLILTHHPLYFVPEKNIDTNEVLGGYTAKLLKAGIGVYSAHTSYDAASGGMNDKLAGLFGLTDVTPLDPASSAGTVSDVVDAEVVPALDAGPMPILRVGVLPEPVTFGDFCTIIENALGCPDRLKTVGGAEHRVKSVAVCGGGGGSYIDNLGPEITDCYITSDVKHHEAQWAKEKGLFLIDAGHFHTENLFVGDMAGRLRETFPSQFDIYETEVNLDPFA